MIDQTGDTQKKQTPCNNTIDLKTTSRFLNAFVIRRQRGKALFCILTSLGEKKKNEDS